MRNRPVSTLCRKGVTPPTMVVNELLDDVLAHRDNLVKQLGRACADSDHGLAVQIEQAVAEIDGVIALVSRGQTFH
ncbi:MAG: hypothetical protein ACXW2I_11855 [Burkholderiales bacterium]